MCWGVGLLTEVSSTLDLLDISSHSAEPEKLRTKEERKGSETAALADEDDDEVVIFDDR